MSKAKGPTKLREMASLSALRSSASVVVAIVVAVVLLAVIGAEAETRKYQFDVSLFVYY